MNNQLFKIEELEARFEMELVTFDDGSTWDASCDQGSEAANSSCCSNYRCIGTVRLK